MDFIMFLIAGVVAYCAGSWIFRKMDDDDE